ncbi:MAG: gamma-glutamyl-gamma-aminobutyrate hydrolase family protein [Clostridia bacterium]|nr:gamma-glutamyl-gamma-aminobutyrate hydrolase family protein [Clostridia bacterium]MDQ7791333.1 gamma-glutamyl-gamma-aminobutyrate hydrolase family protein [Clostridia bacterium]
MIGITCEHDDEYTRIWLYNSYFRAVEKVGGVPLLIPSLHSGNTLDSLVSVLGGLILSGGGDVDPHFFGEEPLPETGLIAPERDVFEITLTRRVLAAGRPVLGVCRGMQVLNIACGGDIYQDISLIGGINRLKHYQDGPRWYPTHEILLRPHTRFASIIGDRQLRVNSFHHQVVRRVAPGLHATAWSRDGIVEVIEGTGPAFVLGVQFHPECMWERYPIFLNIFEALAQAADASESTVKQSIAKIIQGKLAF